MYCSELEHLTQNGINFSVIYFKNKMLKMCRLNFQHQATVEDLSVAGCPRHL